MFGPRPPINNNVSWNYHGPPRIWRPNFGPRAAFRSHPQRFNSPQTYRPQLQQQGNENYWCETCDRGFFTEDILNKHKQQHQKCNIDGCQFVAHPKVITKHIQMQHSTGLYKKISNINRPEDIEKWREERRKRYPTKANIDKKAAFLKEKIERGEKMGLERNKNNLSADKRDNLLKRKNSLRNENLPRSRFKGNRNNSNVTASKKLSNPLPSFENKRQLKPFSGILNLNMDNDVENIESTEVCELIEDDICEGSINNDMLVDPEKPVVCGALSSLICDYGSTDEEDNIDPSNTDTTSTKHAPKFKEVTTNKEVNINYEAATPKNKATDIVNRVLNENQNTNDPNQANNDNNDSGPEEANVMKKDDMTIPPPTPLKKSSQQANSVKKRSCIGKKQNFKQGKPKLPSTLLHKLLHREMQQERNIVLQCIRYIRKNNYFNAH